MDVARAAEVSIASASRALNGLENVTPDTRSRVLDAARKLRYVPNWGARSLAMNRTHMVGLVLPDLHGEFFSELIRGVDAAARARGLHLLVSGSHGDALEAVEVVRAMAGRVDGLLVMSPYVESADLGAVLPAAMPFATLASPETRGDQRTIRVDNFAGAVAAVRHLADVGCARIAHISGPATNIEAAARRRGYEAAMAELWPGAPAPVLPGDFNQDSGYAAMRAFLASEASPDGVFAANDMMALGALLALKEAGRAAPHDVAVVGFDDIPMARFTSPQLTTLRVGVYEMGRRGLELLAEGLDGETPGEGLVITPELIVRESSARQAVVQQITNRGPRRVKDRGRNGEG